MSDLDSMLELEDEIGNLREENKELTERLSAALETVVAFERVNKEWEQLWKPIDDLVRPITPLGGCVGHKAVELITESVEQPVDNKAPDKCRNKLRDEGKLYPKSGCEHCKTGGITGCPYETKHHSPKRRDCCSYWRNDALESAVAIAEGHGNQFIANDIRVMISKLVSQGEC